MSERKTVEKDGVIYSIHSVSGKGIPTGQPDVEVAIAETYEVAIKLHEAGKLPDEKTMMSLAHKQLAIQRQASARRSVRTGKIPKADYIRLFNELTKDESVMIEASESNDFKGHIDKLVIDRWTLIKGSQADEDSEDE